MGTTIETMKRVEKQGFAPITNKRCVVLVLGSLPGDRSILADEYYAHPQNQFWRLIGFKNEDLPKPVGRDLAEQPQRTLYETKVAYLLSKRIALWDVLGAASRDGSLDSNIRAGIPNDFDSFFREYPQIETIYFNGQTAQKLFLRHAKTWVAAKTCILLPSSSPAHTMPLAKKQVQWDVIKTLVDNPNSLC